VVTQIGTSKLSDINRIYNSSYDKIIKKVDDGKLSVNQAAKKIKRMDRLGMDLDEEAKGKTRFNLDLVAYEDDILRLPYTYKESHINSHVIKEGDKFPTLTTSTRLFHPAEPGSLHKEYTIREYADVQDFPPYSKFAGTFNSALKQIGNAVSTKMGAYITKDLKGKTCGDLFAGCGGFSFGAEQNDIKSIWAVEWDVLAAKSYEYNFPDTKVHHANIKLMDPYELEKVDIIIGGPPCQGFSVAGDQNETDPRNEMYKEFHRFVKSLKPGEFIMENVPQIERIKDQIISDFNDIGYDVRTELVKGEDIGMRQKRHRFFFIGTRRQKLPSQFATKTD
jgi:site-specific DNA-cytosine methylase